MTNSNKLKGRIIEKGFNLTTFSKAIAISRPCLRQRLNGNSDFRVSEIERVCAVLEIPHSEIGIYFFNHTVPIMETRP